MLIPLKTETKAPNKATKTKTTNSRLTSQDLSATPTLNKKTKTKPHKRVEYPRRVKSLFQSLSSLNIKPHFLITHHFVQNPNCACNQSTHYCNSHDNFTNLLPTQIPFTLSNGIFYLLLRLTYLSCRS